MYAKIILRLRNGFYTKFGKGERYLNWTRIFLCLCMFIDFSEMAWPIDMTPFASRRTCSPAGPVTISFLQRSNFYAFSSTTQDWLELSGWNILHLLGVVHQSVPNEKMLNANELLLFIDFISLYLCLLYKFMVAMKFGSFFTSLLLEVYIVRFYTQARLTRLVLSILRSFRYTLVVDFSCFFAKEILIFAFLQVVRSSCGSLEI